MIIAEILEQIKQYGPDRVMVGMEDAVSSRRAREEYGINPDVIFIRNDGWSLAAPSSLEHYAWRKWAEEWTHFIRRPNIVAIPIEQYK